jgi:hypothetical protein
MDIDKLLQLFFKYLNPPINSNGLILTPHFEGELIRWVIENPDNLSYSTDVVEGHIQELLYQFQISTGTKDLPEWKNCWVKYCKVTDSEVYINRELSNKINQRCDRLNTIKLIDGGDVLKSDCYVRDWSIEYRDEESLYFHVSLELSNPKTKKLGDIDDDTLAEFIEEFGYNDTAQEQETDLLWDIITPILDEENMYDKNYMMTVGLINYFDSYGTRLE